VAGFLVAVTLGMSVTAALYVAVALTFSSTIMIVKLLSDKREVDSLHGRIAVGFLIVQDIVVVLVKIGIPLVEIIREVIAHDRDLVIKNASGDNRPQGRLFGSTDMHLLRKCPCPVWVLRPEERGKYKRIVAAVDFDPREPDDEETLLNRRILELGGSLALSDFAELHLVHVWEPLAERLIRLWSDDVSESNVITCVERERQQHRAGLERLASELRKWLGAQGCDYLSPQLHVQKGDPRRTIPAVASELRAELLIMGTVARTGIPGFFIGNTAESILYNPGCSVMAVKPEGFVSPVTLDDANQAEADTR